MSFLNQLLKGFIRSAVNQVGRDGGKVVSNKVYKGRHSTPVHRGNPSMRIAGSATVVSTNAVTADDSKEVVAGITRADLLAQGYEPELFDTHPFLYIFLLLGACILVFVGPLYFIYRGLVNLFRKSTRFYRLEQQPTYVSDRRYREGVRQEGYKNVKVYCQNLIAADTGEIFTYRVKGLVALFLGVSLLFVHYGIFADMGEDAEPTTQVEMMVDPGVVTANHGLNLRTEGNENAQLILNIPKGDTVKILKGEAVIVNDLWYQVNYGDTTGWVYKKYVEVISTDNESK